MNTVLQETKTKPVTRRTRRPRISPVVVNPTNVSAEHLALGTPEYRMFLCCQGPESSKRKAIKQLG